MSYLLLIFDGDYELFGTKEQPLAIAALCPRMNEQGILARFTPFFRWLGPSWTKGAQRRNPICLRSVHVLTLSVTYIMQPSDFFDLEENAFLDGVDPWNESAGVSEVFFGLTL
ncbi:hypothetical protein P1P75_40755 [Streptomyces sp. ID05-39B]|uniref:hypothetical protein n=1 Tax=Streptomyces sp. ID05-39B TaxID=3028664 RepID=UPI0029A85805|nr:hypothetical protein [Streptomyces sp. ID05-39B]MDX3532561.1 hypothetical protein [Streptomyces sp. ID05-39B]